MLDIFEISIFASATAALCSFLTVFPTIKLAHKFGLIDDPQKNKHVKVIHTYPVPRAGGLPLFLGILIPIFFFLPLDKYVSAILVSLLLITLVGLLDDKFNLSPYLRLLMQFGIAAIPVSIGVGINFISLPFFGLIDFNTLNFPFLSTIFSILWIVAIMNYLNLGAKGIDGQLPGVVAIAAIVIALLSLNFSADLTEWPVIILAAITAGSFLGFLPANFYPQKIMPGFGGSNIGGFMLAVLSILSTAKVGTLLVVLGVPLVDTTYVIIRRISRVQAPFWGDRTHLHHKLLDYGFTKRQVVYFYWGVTALLGLLALKLTTDYKLYTIAGTALFVVGLLKWLTQKK